MTPINPHRNSRSAAPRFATALALTFVLVALATLSAAQTFSVRYVANTKRGSPFWSSLVEGPDGALYGTTAGGGTGTACYQGRKFGCGTVFQLTQDGKYKVLYSFQGGLDGSGPTKGVVRDGAGNLYGTTSSGGTSRSWGTVFKLDSAGQETILYNFTGGVDGTTPFAGVVRDNAGSLYGTTEAGGAFAFGTIYKLDPTGTETVLYSFTGMQDGGVPSANVRLDAAGNIYGTASLGGDPTCSFGNGCGVIFKLDAAGQYSVLHTFTGTDGRFPSADVVLDAQGNIYGTSPLGGDFDLGLVFKLDPAGNYTVLHSFSGVGDGTEPVAGVILDKQGNLYGTAAGGGWGTVFKLDPAGTFTTMHTFVDTDGASPRADLFLDKAGVIYGTTDAGGDLTGCHRQGCGVVFSIVP